MPRKKTHKLNERMRKPVEPADEAKPKKPRTARKAAGRAETFEELTAKNAERIEKAKAAADEEIKKGKLTFECHNCGMEFPQTDFGERMYGFRLYEGMDGYFIAAPCPHCYEKAGLSLLSASINPELLKLIHPEWFMPKPADTKPPTPAETKPEEPKAQVPVRVGKHGGTCPKRGREKIRANNIRSMQLSGRHHKIPRAYP